jgi:serine/threonine protein kinase
MLCEMIGGFNPFTGGNIHQTFENILTLNINWPKNISNQCKNLLQSIFVVDPNLRASIQEIKKHGFFHGFHWYDLESSISTENKEELLELLADVKKDIEKEDLKDREEREKLSTKKRLSVQTKNLQNQPCLTEVTEEEKKNELSDPVDSDNFSQVCDDFEEITPLELLQPKSAGLPFKMKFFAPHLHNDSDSRINVSDFSMRKNQLAFKDF